MNKRWLTAGVIVAGAALAVVLFPYGTKAQSGLGAAVPMKGGDSFRILFGLADQQPTPWDGSVKVSSGAIRSITGWRFFDGDVTDFKSTWKLSTRRNRPLLRPNGPIVENGIIITAEIPDENVKFDIQTVNGSFSFAPKQVPFGEGQTFLDGRVAVDRVPPTVQVTPSQEDEDFPAIAQNGDDVWATYVEFTHGDREHENEGPFRAAPADFGFLTRPVGGDRVMLTHFSKATSTWEPPIAVSENGLDVMRAAVAVDGQKRVWVVWSANKNGNFDLYAKYMDGGKWSPEIRVTTDPGTDLNPVATTDARGRVWIAWQAYRGDNLDILAAVQSGDRFVKETRVSFSPRSDWDPSITAAANGDVAIAWDTYDKGDYDVYFRRVRADLAKAPRIGMDAPVAVAASAGFEARSSIVTDAKNRLWVAYEASDTRWGKDYGAYQTTGIALYQGHNIKIKCFDGNNVFTTTEDVEDVLPGPPQALLRRARRRVADQVPTPSPESLKQPNPDIAKNRRPNQGSIPPPLAQNSFPRLAVDSAGTVYLAYRAPGGAWISPVGSVWFENVVYFDGTRWNGPLFVPRTDGLLDVRPALAVLDPGHLVILSAMDHRQSEMTGNGRRGAAGVNSDIYAADLRVDVSQSAATASLKPLSPEHPAVADDVVKPELDQVALMRNYRLQTGKDVLHVMRGEFHRHTEISQDGRNDGPLIDAYRYMIDAAYMDWVGCCDHDNGGGHEYFWWLNQKLSDAYHLGNKFVPMFAYERSVAYPEGHRNVVFPVRGIRPLPRLPKMADDSPSSHAPDTQMLYKYLRQFGGIVASHTSGTNMGTDWRDNDPLVEPVVEIYQGDRQNYEMPGAPRSNSENDSIGGWRPLGFVSLALQKGYRLAFEASSDHISTHMSYCNLWVTAPTREGIMEAFRKRRVYGATDNILADVRCGNHMMGEEFSVNSPPSISVKLIGTAPFAKVQIVKDNNYVYSIEPKTKQVVFTWQDNAAAAGKTSYYYVRGEQEDGQLVWVSPMWITLAGT